MPERGLQDGDVASVTDEMQKSVVHVVSDLNARAVFQQEEDDFWRAILRGVVEASPPVRVLGVEVPLAVRLVGHEGFHQGQVLALARKVKWRVFFLVDGVRVRLGGEEGLHDAGVAIQG